MHGLLKAPPPHADVRGDSVSPEHLRCLRQSISDPSGGDTRGRICRYGCNALGWTRREGM